MNAKPHCRTCGRTRGHSPKCPRILPRPRLPRRPDAGRWTVDDARRWLREFGYRADLISPTGRDLFAMLLRRVDELEVKAGIVTASHSRRYGRP